MNYEEKYKEILEWARKNKARLNGVPIEEVLPELRESEDERIINQLITLVNSAGEVLLIPTNKEELITWLEKQKEQKPAEWSDTNELVFQDICKHLNEEGYGGWVVLLNALRNGEFQPKQEWSEEDEDNLCRVIRVLEDNDSDWKELSNWLKSLKPSWKPSEDELGRKHLDGYIMGMEDAMREMKDFIESHFSTQSGTSTLKAEG